MSAAAAASRTSYREKKDVENKKQTVPEVITNDLRRDKAGNDALVDSKILGKQKKSIVFIAPVVKEPKVNSMIDRTEKSCDDNKLLASQDNDDGMPRYYAMIYKAI
ncbi:hypothetical protein RND71_015396 [Anisodus tanguticus]|uniref:Uncharacterized protein n=1 Tax=Anisodus tanguticus TaxID=243964 RepID=A0AAE1S7A7_9SOLA|nr:hypothetical protein RND71_015396 [Anisodus tanguticus]